MRRKSWTRVHLTGRAGLLSIKARQRIGERWGEDNREAISEYNSCIAREGLPLAKYRTF